MCCSISNNSNLFLLLHIYFKILSGGHIIVMQFVNLERANWMYRRHPPPGVGAERETVHTRRVTLQFERPHHLPKASRLVEADLPDLDVRCKPWRFNKRKQPYTTSVRWESIKALKKITFTEGQHEQAIIDFSWYTKKIKNYIANAKLDLWNKTETHEYCRPEYLEWSRSTYHRSPRNGRMEKRSHGCGSSDANRLWQAIHLPIETDCLVDGSRLMSDHEDIRTHFVRQQLHLDLVIHFFLDFHKKSIYPWCPRSWLMCPYGRSWWTCRCWRCQCWLSQRWTSASNKRAAMTNLRQLVQAMLLWLLIAHP